MKKLTKLVLESGLLDKTTAILMERWGQLDPGASELVGTKVMTVVFDPWANYQKRKEEVQKFLENFVEELELLSQPEAIERQEVSLEGE